LSPSPSRRAGLSAAASALGVVVALTSGMAFAASGHAPWSHQSTSGSAAGATPHVQPTHPSHPTHPAATDATDATDGTDAAGPNAHAFPGLCHAYAAGQKATHGKAWQAPPFLALTTAAGGAENVAAFCAALATTGGTDAPDAARPSGHPTHPAHPTHPVHPTHPASPTHPVHPTHPTHPTHGPKPHTSD
jgi:hypothetical protein